jgi:hypothetical protein
VVKLNQHASGLLQEHSDCVLFANYKVGVTEEKLGFDQKRTRAVGSGQRVLYTQERPAYSAKNRFNLPDSVVLDESGKAWITLAAHIPYLQQFAQEDAETQQPTTQGE